MGKMKAFTLIEVLVVVVVVAILAGIALILFNDPSEEARQGATAANEHILQGQIEIFKTENGVYPTDLGELVSTSPPYVTEIPGGEAAWVYQPATGLVQPVE
jgi:prepilin-type N-terminal cleavage/methylation domain-containing protein